MGKVTQREFALVCSSRLFGEAGFLSAWMIDHPLRSTAAFAVTESASSVHLVAYQRLGSPIRGKGGESVAILDQVHDDKSHDPVELQWLEIPSAQVAGPRKAIRRGATSPRDDIPTPLSKPIILTVTGPLHKANRRTVASPLSIVQSDFGGTVQAINMEAESPRSNRRRRIPNDIWEDKRAIITELYQEQNIPLHEVMQILSKDYGFNATKKMFKSRITKWKLDKKLKGEEVLALLFLRRDRERLDKPTEYTIRGRPVDLDNINRYVKRNPSLWTRFCADDVPRSQYTLEVRCHTPPPSPSPSLSPPPELSHTEEVLCLFRDYIDGSLSSGAWDLEFDVSCTSYSADDRSEELLERVITSFALVNRCMTRGDAISINAILNPAFESLREIISAQSPIFAVRTVCLLWYLDQHHKTNLLGLVIDFLSDMVPIVLGQHHILTRIWRILGKRHFSDYYELSLCLYSMMVPLLEHRIGAANELMTVVYSDHIDCLYRKRSAESMNVANRYREKVDATGHQHPWLVELAIAQTAIVCAHKEADGHIDEAIDCLQTLKSYDMSEDQEAVLNIQLGNYSYRLNDIPSAIQAYRDATRLAVSVDGDERLLLTCLANLESAMVKGCRTFEAARIRDYRLKRIADFADESRQFASRTPRDDAQRDFTPAIYDPEQADYIYSHNVPSWIWLDDDESQEPQKDMNNMQMSWLGVSPESCDFTDSVTDSHPDTSVSQFPSLTSVDQSWEDNAENACHYAYPALGIFS
ncbi:hypothetical protein HJFPF1_07791 [Paramyrothecium foliicola]|nr:hypothetical protein HJFPF1_07791 [Paramyrothecium foliicola]